MSDATPPTSADSPDSPRGPTPGRGLWMAIMAMGIVVLALAALAINTAPSRHPAGCEAGWLL